MFFCFYLLDTDLLCRFWTHSWKKNTQMHLGWFKNYPPHRSSAIAMVMGPHPAQLSGDNNSSRLGTSVRTEGRWEEACMKRVHKENFHATNTAEEPGKSKSHKNELCSSIITWKHSRIKDYLKASTTAVAILCCSWDREWL